MEVRRRFFRLERNSAEIIFVIGGHYEGLRGHLHLRGHSGLSGHNRFCRLGGHYEGLRGHLSFERTYRD